MINKKNVENLNLFENSVKKRHNLSLDTQINQSDNENKELDTDYEDRDLNLFLARGGCNRLITLAENSYAVMHVFLRESSNVRSRAARSVRERGGVE